MALKTILAVSIILCICDETLCQYYNPYPDPMTFKYLFNKQSFEDFPSEDYYDYNYSDTTESTKEALINILNDTIEKLIKMRDTLQRKIQEGNYAESPYSYYYDENYGTVHPTMNYIYRDYPERNTNSEISASDEDLSFAIPYSFKPKPDFSSKINAINKMPILFPNVEHSMKQTTTEKQFVDDEDLAEFNNRFASQHVFYSVLPKVNPVVPQKNIEEYPPPYDSYNLAKVNMNNELQAFEVYKTKRLPKELLTTYEPVTKETDNLQNIIQLINKSNPNGF